MPSTESSFPHDPAEALLGRFLAEHPDGGLEEFSAWMESQPAVDGALEEQVAQLLAVLRGVRELADAGRRRDLPLGALAAGGLAAGGQAAGGGPRAEDGWQVQVGSRIGRFELREFVARGGMGQVWRALDHELRREVALKLILPERVDTRSLALFAREARAGGRVQHPNLVTTLDHGLDGDLAWIAQEYVGGARTLKSEIERTRQAAAPPKGYYRQVAELVAALLDGLEAAHLAGVWHRDIKPANVLIDGRGVPKLSDFGLARLVDESALSQSGDWAGTAAYMSPEQVQSRRSRIDQRTDIFSMGVVLYELLSLRRPFEGDTTVQVIDQILNAEAADPRTIRSQCPRELALICAKAMEKQPGRRYPSAAEFAADLRRYLEHQPIVAKPTGPLRRLVQWTRRYPVVSAALSVALLGTAVVSVLAIENAQLAAARAEQTRLAERNASAAERNATAAQQARAEATQRANDLLSLSAQKDHDDLLAEAAELWPAHPERIPAYEDWLRRANELIHGRPADQSKGLKKRPSLAEHKAKLAELRADAKPLSEAEIAAERELHPKFAELQAKQAELLWRSRMLGLEPWPSEATVEAELAREDLPTDADALNSLAWPLVDPAKPVYGQEVRALLLARRGVAAASEEKRSGIRDSLAWALFKLSRFDESLSEERTAQSEPGGEALKSSAADLEKAVAGWRGDELAKQRETRDKLTAEVASLDDLVNERRTYEFDDPEKDWWNRQLVKLVSDLEALRDPQTGLMHDVLAEPFGWGVAKRYAFAKTIRDVSVDSAEAKPLWTEAIAAIQDSAKYGGLEIMPQMGLLPIGMDPDSQLWEFAHLQTGDPAVRGEDGKLVLTEETGLVFVLIPGGTFWMGARNKPGAQNHDPQALSQEGPVHEVELSPYFLSKFEMTQGQWERIAAANPSLYKPPGGLAPSLLHPVEQVSWPMCFDLLESLGLSLPSEAQWEFGARGGTSTAWWTGQERESLRGKVNLADQTAKKARALWPAISDWPDLEDGSVVHSEVGRYPPNAFGLHEVAGNVWEWCLDGYSGSAYREERGRDPVVPWDGSAACVSRGGSFINAASNARSAVRNYYTPEFRVFILGLRPARPLQVAPGEQLRKEFTDLKGLR